MSKYKRAERELFTSQLAQIGTKGRKQKISEDPFRTDFQRDAHRIIYSQAFRRLRHKTQVFYFPQNDHVTTRMDHVLFVASASRTVTRCLGLNEDLSEAIGLGHDIGHAPFGHQGEEFLNNIIKKHPKLKKVMPEFNHEVYGLRVVDKLAKRDREVPGLDLTWEVRDGIVSHCGEDRSSFKLSTSDKKEKDLESIKTKKEAGFPATLEGCIVRLVDKITYFGKDIEDALETETIKVEQIPPDIKNELGDNRNGKIIGFLIRDMIENSYGKDYIAISPQKAELMNRIIDFDNENIYHSDKSEGYKKQAEHLVSSLYDALLIKLRKENKFKNGELSKNQPFVFKVLRKFVCEDMKKVYDEDELEELIVLDFMAGMTDNFVLRSFQELFIPQATV